MLLAYKLNDGRYVCLNCCSKDSSLLESQSEREPIFSGEVPGTKMPKCSACGKKLNKLEHFKEREVVHEPIDITGPDFVDIKLPILAARIEKTAVAKPLLPSEPKRRGRPKGSKNRPKGVLL